LEGKLVCGDARVEVAQAGVAREVFLVFLLHEVQFAPLQMRVRPPGRIQIHDWRVA
jgi:hypothetical protein